MGHYWTNLGTEAVATGTNPLITQLLPNIVDHGLNDGIDFGSWVVGEPGIDVEISRLYVTEFYGVAMKEIRNNS